MHIKVVTAITRFANPPLAITSPSFTHLLLPSVPINKHTRVSKKMNELNTLTCVFVIGDVDESALYTQCATMYESETHNKRITALI